MVGSILLKEAREDHFQSKDEVLEDHPQVWSETAKECGTSIAVRSRERNQIIGRRTE